jgi:hypothetical protein
MAIHNFLQIEEKLDDEAFRVWKSFTKEFRANYLEAFKSPETPFDDHALQAVAHYYDHPVIEFSNKNKMAFFDRLYKAKTERGNK